MYMTNHTLLIVEDEIDVLMSNKEFFEMRGYIVHTAERISEAKLFLEENTPDLIILDVMLPDGSGVAFCKELHKWNSIPTLFLTCISDKQVVIEGIKNGGDDYMTKPYVLEELGVRCEAILRRASHESGLPEIDGILINTLKKRVYLQGQDVVLKPREYYLFVFLLKNMGKKFTAEELYRLFWEDSPNNDIRTVQVHISQLRKKLKMDNEGCIEITTLERKYYCLDYKD